MLIQKEKKSKNTLIKILIYIIISISITTLFLSAILYYFFENVMVDFIHGAKLKQLNQISNSINYLDETAKNFGISLLMNNDAKMLLYSKDDDSFFITNSYNSISKVVSAMPFVHSVYIYNNSFDIYYSTFFEPISKENTFFDKQIIGLRQNLKDSHLIPVPRKIQYSYNGIQKYDNVYSYVFYDKYISGSAKEDCIVVNLDIDWLTNQIDTMKVSQTGFEKKDDSLFIIDSNGRIINHSDKQMFLKDISSEPYIKNIINRKNTPQGFFIDYINKQKSLITFVYSQSESSWICVNVIPYKMITNQLIQVKFITIFTSFAMIIIGFFIALIVSKKIYNPIRLIVSNIRNMVNIPIEKHKTTDELSFITNAFNLTIDKANHMEDLLNKNTDVIKHQILNDLLIHPSTIVEMSSILSGTNISLNIFEKVCIILIRIDNYNLLIESIDSKDISLYKISIQSFAHKLFNNEFSCETIDMNTDSIAIIVNISYNGDIIPDWESKIVIYIKQLGEVCEKEFNFSFSSTYSFPGKSMGDLYILYKETYETSNYRILYGYGCIISCIQFNNTPRNEYNYPLEKQNALLDELKLGKRMKVEDYFNDIKASISKFTYPNIILSYSILASNIFNTLSTIQNNGLIDFEIEFHTFSKEIISLETLSEINAKFEKLFDYIFFKMTNTKDEKLNMLVENIKHIIINNYMMYNLSIDSIADANKMSPDYIGKIFKEHTTTTISDYITNMRLEHAKELLIKTNMNINDISEKIGLCSSKYLFKIFKKRFGVTPGEFRLKNSISAADNTDNERSPFS